MAARFRSCCCWRTYHRSCPVMGTFPVEDRIVEPDQGMVEVLEQLQVQGRGLGLFPCK